MKGIQIIKYQELTATLTSPSDLDSQTDRAITDYRSFLPVGMVHASRVTNCLALDVMIEVVDNLHQDLTAQKNRLQRT